MGRASLSLLLAALPALVAGCSSIRPASPEQIARLETPSREEDREQLARADALLAQGRHEPVLDVVRELLPANPGCAPLAILASRAVGQAPEGDRERLREEFRGRFARLLRVPENKGAAGTLAFGIALFARDDRERRRWLDNALQSDPDHWFALCKHGEDLWLRGELEAAKNALTRAVVLRKELAEAWLLLAQVAEDRGFYRTADKHYRAYLGLRPLDRRAMLNYVRLLVHMLRDGERAARVVDALQRADPTNVEVGLHRGLAYFLQEDYAAAESAYKEMLRRYPREPRVVLSLGNLYHGAMNEPLKALQAYRYLLTLATSTDPQTALHQALFVPGRIKDIEKALGEKGMELPAPPASVDDLLAL